ncbi:MAG: hypothetical protein V7731_18870 [Amphritea sp.]
MFANHPTKAQLRLEHEKHIKDFLTHKGKIQQVSPGASGLIDGQYKNRHIRLDGTHKSRTPVTKAILAIEARRVDQKVKAKARPTTPKRKFKIILDDFGEPIRTIWCDA